MLGHAQWAVVTQDLMVPSLTPPWGERGRESGEASGAFDAGKGLVFAFIFPVKSIFV